MSMYSDATQRRAQNIERMVRLATEHRAVIAEIEAVIREDEALIVAIETGVSAEVFLIARQVVRVEWGNEHLVTTEVEQVFADAIEDIRAGGPSLAQRYMGVKSYAHWHSQRADHQYGMRPRSGVVWFRIGLVSPDLVPIPEETRIAVVAWLMEIQANPSILLEVSA